MASNALHTEILQLEEETWRALQRRGADLVPYLTPDCIMLFPMGMKVTARSSPSVHDILHSPGFVPWKTFRLTNVDVLPLGPEGAVIGYRATATRAPSTPDDPNDVEFDALCSSVWRMEGGKWMMACHQQTMTA